MLKARIINYNSSNVYKFSSFLIENVQNYSTALNEKNYARELTDKFNQVLSENDNVYIVKDKTGHLDCCQYIYS